MYLLLLCLFQQGIQVVGILAILLSEGTEFLCTLLHGFEVLLCRAYGFLRPCTLRVAVNVMVGDEKQQTTNLLAAPLLLTRGIDPTALGFPAK
jgi:hypothetical protein